MLGCFIFLSVIVYHFSMVTNMVLVDMLYFFYVFCFYHLPHLLSYSVLSIVEFVFLLYVHLPFCSSIICVYYVFVNRFLDMQHLHLCDCCMRQESNRGLYLSKSICKQMIPAIKISLTIYHKNIYIKKTSETSLTQCRFSSSFRRRVKENYSTMCLSGKLKKSKMDWKHNCAVTKIKCYGREVWTQTGRKSCSL